VRDLLFDFAFVGAPACLPSAATGCALRRRRCKIKAPHKSGLLRMTTSRIFSATSSASEAPFLTRKTPCEPPSLSAPFLTRKPAPQSVTNPPKLSHSGNNTLLLTYTLTNASLYPALPLSPDKTWHRKSPPERTTSKPRHKNSAPSASLRYLLPFRASSFQSPAPRKAKKNLIAGQFIRNARNSNKINEGSRF